MYLLRAYDKMSTQLHFVCYILKTHLISHFNNHITEPRKFILWTKVIINDVDLVSVSLTVDCFAQ